MKLTTHIINDQCSYALNKSNNYSTIVNLQLTSTEYWLIVSSCHELVQLVSLRDMSHTQSP